MANKKHILITGANGQLGMEFRLIAKNNPSFDFTFLSREELSIADNAAVELIFVNNKFTHCVNCAGYTAVDRAETDKENCFLINATAPADLAAVCKRYGTTFFHISTDYVFDGLANRPYMESDPTNPRSIYGASKLEGEIGVQKNNEDAIIIRTSWVFSSYGKNFVKTMLKLLGEKDKIGVVNDQYGCPTYAQDLALAILKIIVGFPHPAAGIYNFCNEGFTTWFEFAREIKKITGCKCVIEPVTTADYPTAAERPGYSVLDTARIKNIFGLTIPAWQESLKKCIASLMLS